MPVHCNVEPMSVCVIQVVHVSAARGDGSPENPERSVEFYYSLDGRILASHDHENGPPDSFVVAGFLDPRREMLMFADAAQRAEKRCYMGQASQSVIAAHRAAFNAYRHAAAALAGEEVPAASASPEVEPVQPDEALSGGEMRPPGYLVAELQARSQRLREKIDTLRQSPCPICGGTLERQTYARRWFPCRCSEVAPASAATTPRSEARSGD